MSAIIVKLIKLVSTALVLVWSIQTLQAAEASGNRTIPLPQIDPNQEMRIITINMEPGQSSLPHRHNAHTFVYVIAGTVEMQVRGGPLMRLGPGGIFYENPDDIHQVSRNASDTEPATIVVHMLKASGVPPTEPVND